jgi:hypothetical protein
MRIRSSRSQLAARGALLLAFALACRSSGSGSGTRAPAPRTDLITGEELRGGQFRNAYEAVRSLRARWLQSRGTDTFLGKPGEVQVHLDDVRLGGITSLREIPVIDVAYMQFFDPASASARWGLDHSHGAIYVSTRPR